MEAQAAVTLQLDGNVAVVTLNRPSQRNALDEGLVAGLAEAFDTAEAEPAITAIVVTGAGTAFCAGAVLDTLIASAEGRFDSVIGVYEAFLRVRRSPLPVIAAVNGPAVGAGLNLALACDVRIAATSARFESRFPALRLHPGGGHAWMLVHAVGAEVATRMAVFGIPLDAAEAKQAGLVSELVEPSDLLDRAIALGHSLSGIDRDFVELSMRTVREARETLEHRDALQSETERQRWSTTRPDFVQQTLALRDRISSRSG